MFGGALETRLRAGLHDEIRWSEMPVWVYIHMRVCVAVGVS